MTIQSNYRLHASNDSPLARAKDRLRIPELWQRLGLPGEAAKSCRSPFRPDRSASFSVSPDGLLWNDFAESAGGDAVAFLARAAALPDMADAARRFISMAGTANAPKPNTSKAKKRPLPELKTWGVGDSMTLARLRRWPVFAGMEIAARRGLLGTVPARDGAGPPVRCWAVTDAAREAMQLRRMDGQPFSNRWDGAAKEWKTAAPFKSKTLTAGTAGAGWPVGAANLTEGRAVLLAEGAPDFLAAFGLAWLAGKSEDVDPVAMLGASNRIAAEALPKFAGKRIRILRQADDAGKRAADGWASQLGTVGAVVDFATVTGDGVADAADAFAAMPRDGSGAEAADLLAGLGKGADK
jgi:hypothetical protein